MRREMLLVASMAEAWAAAPWAAIIVKVDGGYLAFESSAEYQTWRRQA
jgi:hypothetical protein